MSRRNALIVALVLLLLALQYQLWFSDGGILHWRQLKRRVDKMAVKTATLEARNQRLRDEVQDIHSDKQALEVQARSELGMVSQGEEFYQIVAAEPKHSKD